MPNLVLASTLTALGASASGHGPEAFGVAPRRAPAHGLVRLAHGGDDPQAPPGPGLGQIVAPVGARHRGPRSDSFAGVILGAPLTSFGPVMRGL